jgi:hypothetical protein
MMPNRDTNSSIIRIHGIGRKNAGVYPRIYLLVLTYYLSFTGFKMKIGQYFRSKCFNEY